jgi:hypothetical protein
MAKYKFEPDYKKYDKILENIKNAHNLIASCHDILLELEVGKEVMDSLGFGLRCIKTGLDKLEIERLSKEQEWNDFMSQFKVITVKDIEEESQEEKQANV